jgi:hypothetical protein
MDVPQGMRCELVRGREDAPLGWVSRRFDQRVPTATLLVKGDIQGNARLTTRIEPAIARPGNPMNDRAFSFESSAIRVC